MNKPSTHTAVAMSQAHPHKPLPVRGVVLHALTDVLAGQSAKQVLTRVRPSLSDNQQGLFLDIFQGTLRYWYVLSSVVIPLCQHSPKTPATHAALIMGAYQLWYTQGASHAIINETVNAIKSHAPNDASLVNALLRKLVSQKEQLFVLTQQQHGLPLWLYRQLTKDWGKAITDGLAAMLLRPAPVFINTSPSGLSADAFCQLHGNSMQPAALLGSVVWQGGQALPSLAGFEQGQFFAQDLHAQLAAHWLGDVTGKSVLDACTAPGGKSMHLMQLSRPASLVALDVDKARIAQTRKNFTRLHMADNVSLITADATQWQSPQPFDVIVLDAPCSATGIIRRQPDIKLHRRAGDLTQLVALQASLLDSMWRQLAVGGELLYITCSILKIENEQQISQFLARTPNAKEVKLPSQLPLNAGFSNHYWGENCSVGRQCLPTEQGGDGFYYAKLRKVM